MERNRLFSDNFKFVFAGELRELGVRFFLVPERDRRDIVLEGQIPSSRPPSQSLDGHSQVLLKAHGIHDVPAVESESCL